MDFFIKLFKKSSNCARCQESIAINGSELCMSCKRIICKNCTIYLKRKGLIFYSKHSMCLDCQGAGRRRSHSANHFAPIELKNASPKDSDNYSESNFALSSRTIAMKKFQEDDFQPLEPLPSTKQVKPNQFLQEIRNITRIEKGNPNNQFSFMDIIGEGGFSTVYKVQNKLDQNIFAIKHIKVQREKFRERVLNEIGIMKLSTHQNIIQLYNCYEHENDFWLIIEYMKYTLSKLVLSKYGKMSEKIMGYICREILQALAFLHRHHRVHRDIKSNNILISESGEIKISDFGVSLQLTIEDTEKIDFMGTPCWMAPEIIEGAYHDGKSDIWSLGIFALELAEKDPPYIHQEKYVAMQNIANGPPPFLAKPSKWSKYFCDFVKKCLTKIPDQRSSAEELLRHTFIKRVGPTGKDIFVEFLRKWEEEKSIA